MSRNIVFEGWLTKSPPSKRIWRTKWRRRWFALRQSGELPGQYFLDYYADRNCRRLKGTINLDLCEQVDAGLHMERAGNGLDPKLRGCVFTIQTQSRTYHLEAESELEMNRWVDAICKVCGLRATEDTNAMDSYQISRTAVGTQYEYGTGPYIPISECVTGVRSQTQQTAFTFEPGHIMTSVPKPTCDKATETRGQLSVHTTQPQIKITNPEASENDSNLSEDDCKSLNASQINLPGWDRTFNRLTINNNGASEDGPPVPPRPPKTFARHKDHIQRDKEAFQGPRIQEPVETVPESITSCTGPGTPWLRVPRRMSHGAQPPSPGRVFAFPNYNSRYDYDDDDDDRSPANQSLQYCNLPAMPPAVDRALKPRFTSRSIGHINNYQTEETRSDVLQYLDLDLPNATTPKTSDGTRKTELNQSRASSGVESDADSAYKTVDFVKTEAFNITRQDAEASRSYQC
ncbi:daughter of sevenless isoform X2 [Anticarsia gemmatalis]|uniref:daughter of sevenless isoform X2 n=1 Tax=Anticarsia gemmatalis TaxID=129554 RepID=UPI003F76D038